MPEGLTLSELFQNPESLITDWRRDGEGRLFRLASLSLRDPGLSGRGGLCLVGFGTHRLTALVAGQSDDLGYDLTQLRWRREVIGFERYGGVWVTWREMPVPYRSGTEHYLVQQLQPVLSKCRPDATAIPVSIPPEFGGPKPRRKISLFV